jgi:hemerythrin-like domain-containing protein
VVLWTMRPEDEQFADNAAELIELLRDHLDAQEQDWFPRLIRTLDRPELDAIGNDLVRARRRAPASPRVGS